MQGLSVSASLVLYYCLWGCRMEEVQKLLHESQIDLAHAGAKGSAGFAAVFASMSINDIAGLVVAVLTGIYMAFQIESAWRKRKAAIKKERESVLD